MSKESEIHGIIMERGQSLIDFAYRFALDAHGAQKRKYTGEPYINHPVAVAHIVMTTDPDCEMVCAALMHDVIEDTTKGHDCIRDAGFREGIADLVLELTDVSLPWDGNRAMRKALDREHYAKASDRAKTIKLADCIHNSISITKYDPDFAKVYMREMLDLIPLLSGGDEDLLERANGMISNYFMGI